MAEVFTKAYIDIEGGIKQCDIIKDVEFIEYVVEKDSSIEISKIVFPKVIVLTQACDLLQDANARKKVLENPDNANHDKFLISVIVAPLYNFEDFRVGEHLEQLGLHMDNIGKINKTPCKHIMQNENKRYHFLKFEPEIGIVDSVIDFKHYFTCNLSYLNSIYQKNYICSLCDLYRESVTQRFANFLSRIGLPDPE